MFIETNPIPVKTALAMMGMVKDEFRLPLAGMNDANRQKLATVMGAFGLMPKGA